MHHGDRGGGFCWRARLGWVGRFREPRFIRFEVKGVTFVPFDVNGNRIDGEPVYIYPDELEAFRLVYLENLTQEDAAKSMGISRGTLWRLLDSARKKIAQALVERRPIVVVGIESGIDRANQQ